MLSEFNLMKNNVEEQKKPLGRPRKYPLPIPTDVIAPPKKRGRKKNPDVETVQKRKRGRKPALKYYGSDIRKRIPLTSTIQDTDKTILHLDIKDTVEKPIFLCDPNDPDELYLTRIQDNIQDGAVPGLVQDTNLIELYESRLQARIAQDSTLIKRLEQSNTPEAIAETLINLNLNVLQKPKVDVLQKSACQIECNAQANKKGYFNVLDKLYNKEWVYSTDICCWWCCNAFDTIPIGMPVDYNKSIKNKFRVKGIFCSFSCMISYGNNDIKKPEDFSALVRFLYKKLTGSSTIESVESYKIMLENKHLDEWFDTPELKKNYIEQLIKLSTDKLEPAPTRACLKMFGGNLSITEFRNVSLENKVYKMIEYPMSISRDYIEELDIKNIKHINNNVFNSTDNKTKISSDEKLIHETRMNEASVRVQTQQTLAPVKTTRDITKFIIF